MFAKLGNVEVLKGEEEVEGEVGTTSRETAKASEKVSRLVTMVSTFWTTPFATW